MSTFCILEYIVINLVLEIGGSPIVSTTNNTHRQIISPGYPGNYPDNVNYTWIIMTEHQQANVTINIASMNIIKWIPCDDYLEIKEIDPCCFTAFKRCGDIQGMPIYVRGKKIRVSFISDSDGKTAKGFNLTWTVTLPPTTTLPKTTRMTTKKAKLTSTSGTTTTSRIVTLPPTTVLPKTTPMTTQKKALTSTVIMTRTSRRVTLPPTTVLPKTTPMTTQKALTSTVIMTTTSRRVRRTTTTTKAVSQSTKTKQYSLASSQTTLQPSSSSSRTISSSTQREPIIKTTNVEFPTGSVTTQGERTKSTNKPRDTSPDLNEIVYLVCGCGAFLLLVTIGVICVVGCRRKKSDDKRIQKRIKQQNMNKRKNQDHMSMHLYSSPMYQTIPEALCGGYEEIGNYARANEEDVSWYAAENVPGAEQLTRVDSFSNVTDVYHTLEPLASQTNNIKPSPLLQRNSNVYHTLEKMTSFLHPEND